MLKHKPQVRHSACLGLFYVRVLKGSRVYSARAVFVLVANGIAQPWAKLPTHIERFLDLAFLVVLRDEA